MKLFYDISVLGGAVGNNSARTGVFRVVENVALQLSRHSEIDLNFTALQRLTECLSYIASHPDFCRTPLPHSSLQLSLEDMKKQLTELIKDSSFTTRQSYQVARGLVSGALKIMTKVHGEGNAKRINCDIFHSPYLPVPKDISSKFKFITVYDLIPILHPQYFKFQKNHLLHRVVRSIHEETWVFCISEATKNDLLNFNKYIDSNKVVVIPLGASNLFYSCNDVTRLQAVRNKYSIPEQPYFLSLSTLEPRKNIDSTIRAFITLVRQENIPDINLVLVGAKGWDFGKIFDEISGCSDLRDRIIVTGYVDDQDLAAIYSGALAFVYPSFYEGFGLPPLEAMQCGIPVITSNTSSLPEVVGDAGIQVDPNDIDALCQAMLEVLRNDELRHQLSNRSRERARLFSWEACADVTINHYRRAMNTARASM